MRSRSILATLALVFAPIPVLVWLVTHREMQSSRRIRLVFDLLAEALL